MKIKVNGSKQLITLTMEAREAILIRDALERISFIDANENAKAGLTVTILTNAIEDCGRAHSNSWEI